MEPYSKRRAKRLLREAGLPARVRNLKPQKIRYSKILADRRLWDPTVCRLYCDYCDEVLFLDPRTGLKLAELAPKLALLVPEGLCGQQQKRELSVRAHAVLGGAYRICGRPEDAEGLYQIAQELMTSGTISKREWVNVSIRLAGLRACQQRFDEGLELADAAVEICHDLDDAEALAEALTVRGFIFNEAFQFPEAIPCFGEALATTTWVAAPRTYHCATHNLAYALTEVGDPRHAGEAVTLIKRASRFVAPLRRSPPKVKLTWLKALAYDRVFLARGAERYFKRALDGLSDLPFDRSLVALDLSALYHRERQWQQLERLASETFLRFRELSGNTEALASLSLWRDAVAAGKLSKKVLSKVRKTIETRIARDCR